MPFKAQYHSAEKKQYAETIVFVHHFGGSAKSMSYHVQLVNSLGFDAVTFDLLFNEVRGGRHLPITAHLKFGARFVWTEQIEAILNALPGEKFIYSFSMPSNSVLAALAHRRAEDVLGWICDGGPFLDLGRCVWNAFEHEMKISNRFLRGLMTAGSLLFYGPGFEGEAAALMRGLPARFPILSIRGFSDSLVTSEAIEAVFSLRTDLAIETLSFEKGKHLDGLRNFRDEYTDRVGKFLKSLAHPVRRGKASHSV